MAECNHDCSHCSESGSCGEEIKKVTPAEGVKIKKVIAVVSGKGGVGKSLTTSLLATSFARSGKKVGILDADITGPSIPRAFNIDSKAMSDGQLIYPAVTSKYGIKIISSNMLIEDENTPIIWRGLMLGNLVKQFFTDVNWEELDVLLIDMPPGTSDVVLTAFQFLPIDGVVVVTTPQSLVSMVVNKAINMAIDMNIPVFGVIENMSYVECKNCNTKNYVFGHSHIDEITKKFDIDLLTQVPLREEIVNKVDSGNIEDLEVKEIDDAASKIAAVL